MCSFRVLTSIAGSVSVAIAVLATGCPAAAAEKTAQPAPPFSIGENDFLLNGQRFLIRCGELHFARIPRQYWRHRLKMCRAMGLNTVCVYLFWNLHEPRPGEFTWEGIADAPEFCRIAQQEGLKVVLRPGPYSCAEWEFGGFPWWLLKKADLRLRTQDPYYLERSRRYLREVGRVLAPLQITRGGPILMVQVENEYGSYGNDKEYLGKLRDVSERGRVRSAAVHLRRPLATEGRHAARTRSAPSTSAAIRRERSRPSAPSAPAAR